VPFFFFKKKETKEVCAHLFVMFVRLSSPCKMQRQLLVIALIFWTSFPVWICAHKEAQFLLHEHGLSPEDVTKESKSE
jgi:hypothetical protein